MLNWIWLGLVLVSVAVAAFTGRMEAVSNASLESAKSAIELIIGLTGLVLLAAVAWACLTLAARVAPERLRVETERRLSELLDASVRVDQTRLSLRWGLILEASGVEVEPAGAEGLLRIERVSARLDPVALWMAR